MIRDRFNQTPAFERVHRVGKATNQRAKPRDIVARFTRFQDRDAVFQERRKLKGTNIYINEDLCPNLVDVRRGQMDALREARRQGKVAFFSYRPLVVRERTTTIKPSTRNQHSRLPPNTSATTPAHCLSR